MGNNDRKIKGGFDFRKPFYYYYYYYHHHHH